MKPGVASISQFVDSVFESGVFARVDDVYDATPGELSKIIYGATNRELLREQAAFVRAGTIAAVLINVNAGRKNKKPLNWNDIFPPFHKDFIKTREQSPEMMKAICRDIAIMSGGKVIKSEGGGN